jgi:hypothetical protein
MATLNDILWPSNERGQKRKRIEKEVYTFLRPWLGDLELEEIDGADEVVVVESPAKWITPSNLHVINNVPNDHKKKNKLLTTINKFLWQTLLV